MQNEQNDKYKKQSVSMPQGLWERCVMKAKNMRPRVSTAAYICSLIEADLEASEQPPALLGRIAEKQRREESKEEPKEEAIGPLMYPYSKKLKKSGKASGSSKEPQAGARHPANHQSSK
jgi:hypothetical protein